MLLCRKFLLIAVSESNKVSCPEQESSINPKHFPDTMAQKNGLMQKQEHMLK